MRIRLSLRDIELMCFLGRYKQIEAVDCKKVYKSKDYYRKRLKVLEKAKYIKREKRYYIKLDIEGRKLLNDFGYDNYNLCRNKDYQDRIKDIAKIAMLSFEYDIKFTPSWELKESKVYTNFGRKYIGELEIERNKYIVYYIANRNNSLYVKQTLTDINKMIYYDKVIVFLEDFNKINKKNKYFMISDKSIQIINPTEENLELIKLFKDVDIYEIVRDIYKGKEILLSNSNNADYMIENERYILSMPFIDTEKLYRLKIFFNSNEKRDRKIDIITLKENKEKINEVLEPRSNIVELDKWINAIC